MKAAIQSGSLASLILMVALVAAGFPPQSASSLPAVERIPAPGAQLISYQLRPSTTVEMRGTPLVPDAFAFVRIRGRSTHFRIEIGRRDIHDLTPPWRQGFEFYTYVLWAVTPDGTPINLGEIPYEGGRALGVEVTTAKQVFWLMVTAEPNFAVYQPSPAVVLVSQSQEPLDTGNKGVELQGVASYRTRYTAYNKRAAAGVPSATPMSVLQARRAVALAEKAFLDLGVDDANTSHPAAYLLRHARDHLQHAEGLFQQNFDPDDINLYGRTASQFAESARASLYGITQDSRIGLLRQQMTQAEQRIDQQQEEMAASQEKLTSAQDGASQLEAALDQERGHTREIESQVLALREQISRLGGQLDSARGRSAELRTYSEEFCSTIGEQLPTVGELRAREGFYELVLASDNLFDSGEYKLLPTAQALLAKVAVLRGLLFPQAAVRYEGHTDLQGSAFFNQWLSEQRALSVYRHFLQEEITRTPESDRRDVLQKTLGDIDTMLGMTSNAVRRQPQRRQGWLDSLGGVVVGKGPNEPLVPEDGPNARNRRVTLVFAQEQAGALASLCEGLFSQAEENQP